MELQKLPSHLSRYIVEQDYSRYTNIDQAVWRFIMRRLKEYLTQHAHESYAEGLTQTGITLEEIPRIEDMSQRLSQFNWKAVAVSGFIPPAAFMELQSLGILPIACDMRSLEHAMYTPAPDIVHEAAGHAPILIHPEFTKYLHEYAQIAKKSILNKEDLEIYEAIRILSDLKEDPNSTEDEIALANKNLEIASQKAIEPSEAALLARMNWWTAEYGLIGDLENPKIYGAGLLSSVGESVTALKPDTKKIPFSLNCLDYAYDITEPQPQLFVTPSFKHLTKVLREMADTMSFKIGGAYGLECAKKARTINTVELNSGLQISGQIINYLILDSTKALRDQTVTYLQLEGPSQLSFEGFELKGQGCKQHAHGFGTPVGKLKGSSKCLSEFSVSDLKSLHIQTNEIVTLEFESGIIVEGYLQNILSEKNKILLLSFKDCKVTLVEKVLFDPAWGQFDMAVGSQVTSVFGGAADRDAFGATEDFVAKRVVSPKRTPEFMALNELFGKIKNVRKTFSESTRASSEKTLDGIIERLNKDFPSDWLSRLEILEICVKYNLNPKGLNTVQDFIARKSTETSEDSNSLREGLRLIEKGI